MAPEKDKLTGLLTRKEFEERFKAILDKAQGTDQIISVAFIDIDHFKRINDEYGHDVGDAVIKRTASLISDVATDGQVAARYGGEEFVLLMPDTEREQAFLLTERARAAMDTPMTLGDNIEERITLSGGVAAFPTDGHSDGDVLRKANQALYRAKVTGRNKICIAQEEKMAPKTTHYTRTQLERLAKLAKAEAVGEATLLREALDDLLIKYTVWKIES